MPKRKLRPLSEKVRALLYPTADEATNDDDDVMDDFDDFEAEDGVELYSLDEFLESQR